MNILFIYLAVLVAGMMVLGFLMTVEWFFDSDDYETIGLSAIAIAVWPLTVILIALVCFPVALGAFAASVAKAFRP